MIIHSLKKRFKFIKFNRRNSLILLFLIPFLALIYSCSTTPAADRFLPSKAPPPKPMGPIKVALVLSGGGSRGLAHAGVIEVLEKNHIPIDLIVGSSAGSFIGALYADDPHIVRLKNKIISLTKWDIIDLSMLSSLKMLWQLNGPVSGHSFRKFMDHNLTSKNFDTLKIPLVAVATDANTGETYPLESGPLIPALQASGALPLVFKPVKLYGRTLIDGGVSSPLPVEVAKQYHPALIIAVDIGTSPNYGPVNNSYQLGNRALHISYYHLTQWQAKQADIVIHPDIDQYSMFEDKCNQEMYEAGKRAAQKALPAIRQKLTLLESKLESKLESNTHP